MKANHNRYTEIIKAHWVVVNISSSKNESKSQPGQVGKVRFYVVVNISSSKNESKSQQLIITADNYNGCCKYQ